MCSKLLGKLATKSMIWPLVSRLAEIARIKKIVFYSFRVSQITNFDAASTEVRPQTNEISIKNPFKPGTQFSMYLRSQHGSRMQPYAAKILPK